MYKTFWWHIDRRANIYVLKIFPLLIEKYLVNFAKPKSAILARPLCKNTLATFKSRCITFFFDKYNNPENISLMRGCAFGYEKWCYLLNLVYKSPPLHSYVII